VVIGWPGDGVVVSEGIRQAEAAGAPMTLAGFLTNEVAKGESVHGIDVLGSLEDWCSLDPSCMFMPAIYVAKETPERAARLKALAIPDERWATVCHPMSCIASDVEIGVGTFLASFVTVQPGARIGRWASLRAGANVGHDAQVSDYCYVGPNATLGGHARLMEGAHLAPNAVVLNGKCVGRFAVVGVGSAVTKNVEDYSVMLAPPARRVSKVTHVDPEGAEWMKP